MADKRHDYFELIKKELIKIFDKSLESIIIYGSAATGEYNERISDINVLVIYNDGEKFLEMRNISRKLRKLMVRGKVNILFFDREEFKQAFDVFPIEFNEIKNKHRVIYGSDFVESYQPMFEEMRLQLENNARSNILKLRQGYIKFHDLKSLVLNSFSSFVTIFRNLLLIKTGRYINDTTQLIEKLSEEFQIDRQVFQAIYEYKYKIKKIKIDWTEIFRKYYIEINKITEKINDLRR